MGISCDDIRFDRNVLAGECSFCTVGMGGGAYILAEESFAEMTRGVCKSKGSRTEHHMSNCCQCKVGMSTEERV